MRIEQPADRWRLPFFTIWTGEAISMLGSNLAQFALVWWLTQTTGSATVLATATLAAILPGVVLGPLAGAYVDRWDRRRIMIVADGVSALAAACLAFLFWTDAIQIWHVYLIMLVRSIGGTFQAPAMQASTGLMVPEQHLSRVAGLNQTLMGTMNIVAPPLGALLLEIMPLHAIMGIDVVTAALAILFLLVVRIPRPARSDDAIDGARPSVLADVRAGLQYVWQWPGMVLLMGIATMINFLLNPAFSLLPLLVTRHFGGEALQLGWMNSIFGIGIVAGGITLGVWGGFRRKIVTSLVGLIGMGSGILLLGLVPADPFWGGLAAIGLAGFMMPLCNGPIMALLQSIVAPDMQGRVFTLIGSLATAMSPLGLIVAGPVADALGVRAWFVIGGAACILMGAVSFLLPAVLRLGDKRDSAVEESRAVQGIGQIKTGEVA
jgi:MFS transporter, DHA3 family, macrolide efflux protein